MKASGVFGREATADFGPVARQVLCHVSDLFAAKEPWLTSAWWSYKGPCVFGGPNILRRPFILPRAIAQDPPAPSRRPPSVTTLALAADRAGIVLWYDERHLTLATSPLLA